MIIVPRFYLLRFRVPVLEMWLHPVARSSSKQPSPQEARETQANAKESHLALNGSDRPTHLSLLTLSSRNLSSPVAASAKSGKTQNIIF